REPDHVRDRVAHPAKALLALPERLLFFPPLPDKGRHEHQRDCQNGQRDLQREHVLGGRLGDVRSSAANRPRNGVGRNNQQKQTQAARAETDSRPWQTWQRRVELKRNTPGPYPRPSVSQVQAPPKSGAEQSKL